MAIIPQSITGHISSCCMSDKIFKGNSAERYGTKVCGIITFCFDDHGGPASALKSTYNAKLIPSPLSNSQIEQHYNEDNPDFVGAFVGNDEEKIYVLGSDYTSQPLIALVGKTFRIKVFGRTYSCTISSDQQIFMLLLSTNNFTFTLENE